jgi:2-methylcitrate dehydratase PrpD
VLPGLGLSALPDTAALINGTAGTFLEMDEGNRFSRGHPAVHVIPAALAVCQDRNLSADRFLMGVLVGYEIGSRIGAASRLRSAMHPHGTWGTVGAAAACAKVAGLTGPALAETLNIATSLTTASSKRTMLEGGLVRNVYAGLANRNGLLALDLTESGFSGERAGIASVFGQVVSDSLDEAALVRGLGSEWHISQNYFKRHSCCRYNHGTLDALDMLADERGLPAPDQIDRIEVATYNLAAELDDPAPRNTLAAKFSVPFALATRIVRGSSGLGSFTWEALRDPQTLALAARVSVREDPAMTTRLPYERPAQVRIHLRDGTCLQAQAGVNRGDDASPYTRTELRAKFLELTGRVWPAGHCDAVLEATLALGRDRPGSQAAALAWSEWCRLLAQAPRAG